MTTNEATVQRWCLAMQNEPNGLAVPKSSFFLVAVICSIWAASVAAQTRISPEIRNQLKADIIEALFELQISKNGSIINLAWPYDQLFVSDDLNSEINRIVENSMPSTIEYRYIHDVRNLVSITSNSKLFKQQIDDILNSTTDASIFYDVVLNDYSTLAISLTLMNKTGQRATTRAIQLSKHQPTDYYRLFDHFVSLFARKVNNPLGDITINVDPDVGAMHLKHCANAYMTAIKDLQYGHNSPTTLPVLSTRDFVPIAIPVNVNIKKRRTTNTGSAQATPVSILFSAGNGAKTQQLDTYLFEECTRFSDDPAYDDRIVDLVHTAAKDKHLPTQRDHISNGTALLTALSQLGCMTAAPEFADDEDLLKAVYAFNTAHPDQPPLQTFSLSLTNPDRLFADLQTVTNVIHQGFTKC